MGYLGSSAMKSIAIHLKCKAERRLMNVTMQAASAKRKLENTEKYLKSQNQRLNNNATSQINAQIQLANNQLKNLVGRTDDNSNAQRLELQNSIFQQQQELQETKNYYDNLWEIQSQAQLDPLRQLSERLEIEKSNAQQDYDFWKQTQESYASKVKEDIKTVVPDAG